jgi:hypothetical protein
LLLSILVVFFFKGQGGSWLLMVPGGLQQQSPGLGQERSIITCTIGSEKQQGMHVHHDGG